jgi:hypothetical protein
MIIKLNRSVRQLCLSLKRPGSALPAVRCQTTQAPSCNKTGNAIKLMIARVGCPNTFWQAQQRANCEPEIESDCGCMQDLVGYGFVPAIELICPPDTSGCAAPRPVVIEYGVATCAPNGAVCFRLDDLLFSQRDGRYHAVVSNGDECLWTGQINLSDGAMRLTEYTTQGASRGNC